MTLHPRWGRLKHVEMDISERAVLQAQG